LVLYSRERKNVRLLNNVKTLKRIAMMKYRMIGNVNSSFVPAIATIIILKTVMNNPLNAVPIVNFETTDYER